MGTTSKLLEVFFVDKLQTVSVLLCIASLCATTCPPRENIKPCSCSTSKIDHQDWISCEGVSSQQELQKAIQGMGELKLSSFSLSRSNIKVLPADLFSDLQIKSLTILMTNISRLSERINRPPFLGLEHSLEELEIQDAFEDVPLASLSLSHLKKLRVLHLEAIQAPTIGNDWFESGPYRLKELHLIDTRTQILGSHAFRSLEALQKLAHTRGSLTSITRNMFPEPALYLESLDYSNNHLSTLPKNIFTRMPSLKEIYLENNDLVNLNEIIYTQVWSQLSHAHFYGNPLNCDQSLQWIYKYRLPEYLEGQCAAPPRLMERSLKNLTLDDFQ